MTTLGKLKYAFIALIGQVQEVVSRGLHFKLPFVESMVIVDMRTHKSRAPANAGTKDLQTVTTEVALNYHLNANSLQDTYSRIGLDVANKVIKPRIQEIASGLRARRAISPCSRDPAHPPNPHATLIYLLN